MITCPNCKHEFLDPERLEGFDAIRKCLDPEMSHSYFYKYHRQKIGYILMRRRKIARFARRGPKPRYFTFKRLLLHYMLDEVDI
jgi:hypothetical protein